MSAVTARIPRPGAIQTSNVEYIAARVIGRETVEYVSNIFKYHIAFKLIAESQGLTTSPLMLAPASGPDHAQQ